jgi:mycobactin polyketide synthetase MbtD
MAGYPLPDGRVPVLLSAQDEALIAQDAANILDYLDRESGDPTVAIASTLLRLRRVRRHRAVARAANRAELVAGLSALARGAEHPLVCGSSRNSAPAIAFVFPGQGNQWPSMGAEAYRHVPAYRAEVDRCAEAFVAAGLASPLPYLTEQQSEDWSRCEIQAAQFTHAAGLAQQWCSHGMFPAVTIGHSLGEVAAAYVAGAIELADAVKLVGARAAVVDRLPGRYAMVVLGVGTDAAESMIAETAGWLEFSAVNGPSSTVVSGDHDAVVALTDLAKRRNVFARQLCVDYPGHTSALRPLRTDLAELMPRSTFRDGWVKFIGATYAAEVSSGVDFVDYWYESLCGTVRFDRAVAAAQAGGADTFIELSAHPSLLHPLAELLDDESAVVVGSGQRDQPITDALSASIATVAIADSGYQWADTMPTDIQPPLRGFPNAPMRAVHLWAAAQPPTDTTAERARVVTVAVEDWRQAALPTTVRELRSGIGVVGDGADSLARRLSEAVVAHPDCNLVSPQEADVVAVIAPALDQLDVTTAVEQIASHPALGLADYAAVIGPRCRAVWLLTTGGELVTSQDAEIRPAQAALAAMHRSAGLEFPDHAFGTLDLSSRDVDSQTAAAVVDVLLGDPAITALRGNARRYFRSFRDIPNRLDELDAAALENVVITGGNGAIGLQYARHCLEHGAQRVILLSRSGVDPTLLGQLAEEHRAEIHAPSCDITDAAALSTAAAQYASDGASLLIHTAGIALTRRHTELTGADLAAVCAAKVAGLALLTELWPLRPECRIVACSSVFGLWGGHSHAAYAASNRLLDVLAAQLRAKGLDCTAIRWGLWQDAGVVEAAEITRTERSGLIAMDPAAALDAGFGRYGEDPLIFTADFDRLRVFFHSQGTQTPAAAGDGDTAHALADVVLGELATTLHLDDSSSIDPDASLIDLGLDSLLALDLRRRLRRAVGHSAPVAQMLGGITVSELINNLQTPNTRKAGTHA